MLFESEPNESTLPLVKEWCRFESCCPGLSGHSLIGRTLKPLIQPFAQTFSI